MPETIDAFTLSHMLIALGLLAAFVVAAWLVNWGLVRAAKRIAEKTTTRLDNIMIDAMRRPVYIGLILCGLYFAGIYLPVSGALERGIVTGGLAALAALGVFALASAIDGLLKWYTVDVAPKTNSALDDRIVAVLRRTIPVLAGALGVLLILEIAGIDLPPVKNWMARHAGRLGFIIVLTSLSIFAIGQAAPRLIGAAVAQRAKGESEDEVKRRADTLTGVLVATSEIIIISVSAFMILSEVGLNITPILTGVGVAGIAIGFGAQHVVKDVLSGLFVILENQYRVGDVVNIAGIGGLVENINLRRTVLRDLDGVVHTVPNGEIRTASNLSRGWARANVNISVAYKEDLDHVMQVINRVGKELFADPDWASSLITAPQALRVDKLGDSGIDIKVLGDTKPLRQWDVMGELRKRLKKAFDQEGIEIPWPHTKVYFGDTPFDTAGKVKEK